MSLAPLLQASVPTQIHAFAAMAAFALGCIQFTAVKGTSLHRILGWIWVMLMVVVCITAFFIHELRIWAQWSPIHLLALYTMAILPFAVWHARNHAVSRHRRAMSGLFLGALVVAGLFTFFPGRIMNAVMFGG